MATPEVDVIKSSELRNTIGKALGRVWRKQTPLHISHNGAVRFALTLDEPANAIPPQKLRIEEAREQWQEILEHMSCLGSRFVFTKRMNTVDEEGIELTEVAKIYLVPLGRRNPRTKLWREHCAEHRETPTRAELAAGQEAVMDAQGVIFDAQEQIFDELSTLSNAVKTVMGAVDAMDNRVRTTFAYLSREDRLYATPEQGTVPLARAIAVGANGLDGDEE